MADKPALLLVATHPRSGTHFAINALCLNLLGMRFNLVRGQFPTLERIFLDHDSDYSSEVESYVAARPGTVTIFKTHMRPSDIRLAVETSDYLSARDRKLVDRIVAESACLHVHRDGRDTAVSWFHYMKDAGGGFPSDLLPRLRAMTFAEFLRMPNKYYPSIRGFQPEDLNRPRFWASCVEEWAGKDGVVQLAFDALRREPATALSATAQALGLGDRLMAPEKLVTPPLLKPPGRGPLARRLHALRRKALARYHRVARGVEDFPPPPPFARRGTSGDWRSYFDEDDHAFFMEHAGSAMRRLGYA